MAVEGMSDGQDSQAVFDAHQALFDTASVRTWATLAPASNQPGLATPATGPIVVHANRGILPMPKNDSASLSAHVSPAREREANSAIAVDARR